MKHNRFPALLLVLILIFSLASCKDKKPGGDAHDQQEQQGTNGTITYIFCVLTKTLHLPNCPKIDQTTDSYNFEYKGSITALLENGYALCVDCLDPNGKGEQTDSGSISQGGEGRVTYIYSVVSKTLHLPDCYHVERMNDDYKVEHTGSIVPMLEKGYTICKDCLIPEDEKEEEPEKEDPYSVPESQAKYAYNKTSRVVHELDCHNIDSMSDKNLRYTNLTLDELLKLKHIPCGSCMPDEYEEYMKNNPDKK